MVPLAPKLKVITYHFISYRRKSVFNLVEIQNTTLFGIADLTRLQLPKCNNHLVSFIKVDGLSVSYIVDIFDTIKSRKMVYRSMECKHVCHLKSRTMV